jgi:alpha-glucosidase
LIGHHETAGNTINYENQMSDAFAYYKKYGVDIVKTGYVGGKLDGKQLTAVSMVFVITGK